MVCCEVFTELKIIIINILSKNFFLMGTEKRGTWERIATVLAVILEVLGVGGGVVRQGRVGDELTFAPSSPNTPISHTSTDTCTLVEASRFFVVSFVFSLVKQLNYDMTLKWQP